MTSTARSSELRVVHRDEHLIVVDKPVGIATTAPEGGPSLFAWVQAIDPRAPALHPLSRLDTQVSGIVAFARTTHANHVALEARRSGRMVRRYLALAFHVPSPEQGEWVWSIGLDARDPKKRVALPPDALGEGVKPARTRYALKAAAAPLVALDLWPHTGRTHQLRVHAARAGCPLAGDVAYGGEKRATLANGRVLTARRAMLHCASLRMPSPVGRGELALELAPPEDLAALWRAAGGDEPALSG